MRRPGPLGHLAVPRRMGGRCAIEAGGRFTRRGAGERLHLSAQGGDLGPQRCHGIGARLYLGGGCGVVPDEKKVASVAVT